MNSLNELLQKMVNMDYDTLLDLAKVSIVDIFPYCEAIDKDNEGVMALTTILVSSVAADGKLSALETKFIGDLTGLPQDAILSLAATERETAAEVVDKFADALPSEKKAAMCTLISAIFACDERISYEENLYLQKILK